MFFKIQDGSTTAVDVISTLNKVISVAPSWTFYKDSDSAAGVDLGIGLILPGSADGESIVVKKMRAGQIQAALISAVGLAEIDRSVTCLQIMPLVFTGFFFLFPSGLVLYWLTNTALSILQQWRINKVVEREASAAA